jgi:hypothetical protein
MQGSALNHTRYYAALLLSMTAPDPNLHLERPQ